MRFLIPLFAVVLLASQSHAAAPRFGRSFFSVAIAPDGAHIASIEGDTPPGGGTPNIIDLVIRNADGTGRREIKLPCGRVPECTPSDPIWAADSRHIAFVLRTPDSHAHGLFTVDATGGRPVRVLAFDGTIGTLRYGPDGTLAMLATAGATKEVGATAPGAAVLGDLDAVPQEQRIAVLRDGGLTYASPPNLYVYEFAWLQNGHGFVGTAAPGDGDQNWWGAKLYTFDSGTIAAKLLYAPPNPQQQITLPTVSPDGKQIAFVGGLMSDFDAVAGDAFVLKLDAPNATAINVTPTNVTKGWNRSVISLAWGCDGTHLRAGLQADSKTQMATLATSLQPDPVSIDYSGEEQLQAGDELVSVACATGTVATIHQGFTDAPEIAVGPMGKWQDVTHDDVGLMPPAAAKTQSISWQRDGFTQQGWLLLPKNAPPPGGLPMIVLVHGGPGAAHTPYFYGPGLIRDLLNAGYAMFLPNPRGSFGQGEAFTTAIVRQIGHGDLPDILAGIDAAERAAPIDDHRLGIGGWSYGGFMAMFAPTQTDRFRAAYAVAGISDWQSYYGQTGIDGWMIPFFGASVYQDPAIYARSSPITFVTHTHTPTFLAVGQRDIECPPAQTIEFFHALRTLGVPTNAVVYAGEGHHFHDPAHVADLSRNIIAWFGMYLRAK